MSYILAALEKADKERRKKRGLTLESVSESQAEFAAESNSGGGAVRFVLLALAGLLIASLIWMAVLNRDDYQELATDPVNASAPPAGDPISSNSEAQQSSFNAAVELPDQLAVEGVMVIEGEASRSRVFIEGRGYREGESFRGPLRITSIDETGVTLSDGTSSRTYPVP